MSGDADSDGNLDIIATTPRGIVSLNTSILLVTASKTNSIGLHIDNSTRMWHNFRGFTIPIEFSIHDSSAGAMNVNKTYPIEMVVAKSSTKVIFRKEYTRHGLYVEHVPFPFPPGFYSITIRLKTDGKIFEETIYFGFHIDVSVIMIFKMTIIIPLLLTLLLVIFLRPMSIDEERTFNGTESLPSHLD